MNFEKILITTDLSEASFHALALAADEQKVEASEIRLISVLQYNYAPTSFGDIPLPPVGSEVFEKSRKDMLAKLHDLAGKYMPNRKVITDVISSADSPGDAICTYAKEHTTDLIVIATTGHSTLNALFTGSTVQRVLLKAECPLLVVPVRR
jgi:nucleotide-binding universal stress UspA family protein